MGEVDGGGSRTDHATHVAATVERTEVRRVHLIVIRIALDLAVEHHAGQEVHGATIHILVKDIAIPDKLHRVERLVAFTSRSVLSYQDTLGCHLSCKHPQSISLIVGDNHVLSVVAKEHSVSNDVGADLQFSQMFFCSRFLFQRGTVATHIDAAADDGGLVGLSDKAQ